jgi:hypothetical protein
MAEYFNWESACLFITRFSLLVGEHRGQTVSAHYLLREEIKKQTDIPIAICVREVFLGSEKNDSKGIILDLGIYCIDSSAVPFNKSGANK